eukprot:SAG11_NODE_5102_length_1664_cov_2.469649_3_plen_183_part_00
MPKNCSATGRQHTLSHQFCLNRLVGPSADLKSGHQRERFFADDDVPLEELVARERKEGRQAKYNAHFAKNVMNDKRMKDPNGKGGQGYDSDDEYGDGGQAYKKWDAKKSRKAGKDFERERSQAIAESRRMQKEVTNVMESPITARHLIISLGDPTATSSSLSLSNRLTTPHPRTYNLRCGVA